jgi:acyl-CoA thioesterase-1
MNMGDPLDLVIYFVGSGLAFFVGAAGVLVGLAISLLARGRLVKLVRNLMVLIGGIVVLVSAAPLDWWLYASLAVGTCFWLPLEWLSSTVAKKGLPAARIGVLAIWMLALGMELPYHFTPALPTLGNPKLFLIGDSVSAGMADSEKGTWPGLLAQTQAINVCDLSKMGATVGSARKQAERIGDEAGLILLEIGGNDLLGSTTADQFDERLDLLLADVWRADRTVVMLELPLLPFANRFGQIQRRLARKYGVILIPKRVFINALTTPGATVDGIHLTREGHSLMAEVMWDVIHSAYGRE